MRKKLTRDEQKFVMENLENFSADQLAEKFQVSTNVIQGTIDFLGSLPEEGIAWKSYLRKSVKWKQLKKELGEEELIIFENQFQALMQQFEGDSVLATEEIQIFQFIKLNILMQRCLEDKQKTREHIVKMEKGIQDILRKHQGNFSGMSESELGFIKDMEIQLGSMRASESSRTSEYSRLQHESDDLIKLLKATREQRVEKIDSGKISFTGLVKELMTKDKRDLEGRQAQLFKLASQKEFDRLSHPHQYMSGEIDLPLLTAETAKNLEDDNETI